MVDGAIVVASKLQWRFSRKLATAPTNAPAGDRDDVPDVKNLGHGEEQAEVDAVAMRGGDLRFTEGRPEVSGLADLIS